ncbi:hypothetical protein [Maritalea porphyrae]|uniref:Uncharacterized protein n=1 Tax=Maritalea porphyrae TaxID=880732 RepID=A0ABQ5URU0_9HYPH|nr:hypothetical protein [Maritalea porphyrae]GLQ17045.1 hypothetical protein GCM10007879_12940 [Maritalea porphyrae]
MKNYGDFLKLMPLFPIALVMLGGAYLVGSLWRIDLSLLGSADYKDYLNHSVQPILWISFFGGFVHFFHAYLGENRVAWLRRHRDILFLSLIVVFFVLTIADYFSDLQLDVSVVLTGMMFSAYLSIVCVDRMYDQNWLGALVAFAICGFSLGNWQSSSISKQFSLVEVCAPECAEYQLTLSLSDYLLLFEPSTSSYHFVSREKVGRITKEVK